MERTQCTTSVNNTEQNSYIDIKHTYLMVITQILHGKERKRKTNHKQSII